ncbi:hypothetical protein JOB18_040429 [Solea senegalensis]|uniref:Endonuclease/exonuclease/phosphatase domain-containing protein n=1 Tax=Solea senegalensis TaxID=28829 RepID=A0AAV6PGA4_SOLSE|nr:hypothetical protein JOB18_014856 [Solea senegalensis]KAG7470444.1 hypothetical protein JOB18_040429 [Solea senegalensis]
MASRGPVSLEFCNFGSVEFTATFVIAADANAKTAMKELYAAVSKQQAAHPEAAFIAAGDFNHSNLKTVFPKFPVTQGEIKLWIMFIRTLLELTLRHHTDKPHPRNPCN